jgi:hypothetical protein
MFEAGARRRLAEMVITCLQSGVRWQADEPLPAAKRLERAAPSRYTTSYRRTGPDRVRTVARCHGAEQHFGPRRQRRRQAGGYRKIIMAAVGARLARREALASVANSILTKVPTT